MKRFLFIIPFFVMCTLHAGQGLVITATGLTPNTGYGSGHWSVSSSRLGYDDCRVPPFVPEPTCILGSDSHAETIQSPSFTTDSSGNYSLTIAASGTTAGCWNSAGGVSNTVDGKTASYSGGSECLGGSYSTVTWTIGEAPTATPTPPPCQWNIDLTVQPRCQGGTVGSGHYVSLMTGGSVLGPYLIPNFSGGTLPLTGSMGGNDITIIIDGHVVATYPVRCSGDPPPTNYFAFNAIVGDVCGATPMPIASPSPGGGSPVPAPTQPPTGPPGPAPGGGPGPSPGPPTGSPSTSVAVANFNDFYEPIRKAVRDSGNDTLVTQAGRAPLAGGTFNNEDMDNVTSGLDDFQTTTEGLTSSVTEMKDKATDKANVLGNITFGSDHVLSVPITGELANRIGSEFRVDFNDYAAGIALFRAFLSWCLALSFFILTIRATVYSN